MHIYLTVLSSVEAADDRRTWITWTCYAKSVAHTIPNSAAVTTGGTSSYICCCARGRVSYLEYLMQKNNLLKYFLLDKILTCIEIKSDPAHI